MGEPRPPWLRPTAAIVALALHLVAFVTWRTEEAATTVGPVEIDVVSDPSPEERPTPESLPAPEARAEAPPTDPEPEPDPEIRPDPEPVVEEPPPEPEPPPPEPEPVPEPVVPPFQPEAIVLPPPVEVPEPVRVERPPEKKPPPKRREPAKEKPRRPPPSPIDSARSEAARAEAAASRAATTVSYSALVSAELRRHRHYPPAAREAGITGTVTVSFVIGADGRVTSHAIVRSSGHAVLDGAARSMMSALSLPPPPGGSFRSTVPVRFDLTH
ncbi:MAG: energy transducer TonB [Siculibacillus sp.]|nr:energy transducer TonB [Siculibacillus sp.]